jgi:hypothetical protein
MAIRRVLGEVGFESLILCEQLRTGRGRSMMPMSHQYITRGIKVGLGDVDNYCGFGTQTILGQRWLCGASALLYSCADISDSCTPQPCGLDSWFNWGNYFTCCPHTNLATDKLLNN